MVAGLDEKSHETLTSFMPSVLRVSTECVAANCLVFLYAFFSSTYFRNKIFGGTHRCVELLVGPYTGMFLQLITAGLMMYVLTILLLYIVYTFGVMLMGESCSIEPLDDEANAPTYKYVSATISQVISTCFLANNTKEEHAAKLQAYFALMNGICEAEVPTRYQISSGFQVMTMNCAMLVVCQAYTLATLASHKAHVEDAIYEHQPVKVPEQPAAAAEEKAAEEKP